MYVVISYTQRDFNTALSAKKQTDFYHAVFKFIIIILFAAPFFALFDYVQELLSLEWRLWLTNLLLSRYFANHAFLDLKMAGLLDNPHTQPFSPNPPPHPSLLLTRPVPKPANHAFLDLKMAGKLDNPDQRICEDVKHFVRTSLNIIITLIEKMMNLVAFAYVLWDISPPLVWFLLAYAVSGTFVVVRVFGKRLTWLQFQGFQREADLRYSLVRVKDNVESIAFYRGEVKEEASAKSFLHRVALNVRNRLVVQFHLSFFTNLYDFATIFVPAVIVAPRYFSGDVEFGVIAQAGYAFSTIYRALTVIVLNFNSFSELAAETERLESLLASLSDFAADDSSKLFSHASPHGPSHGPSHPPHSHSHPSHTKSTTKDPSSHSSTSSHSLALGHSLSLQPSHTTSASSSSLAPTLSGQRLAARHTSESSPALVSAAETSADSVVSGVLPGGSHGEGAPLLELSAMGGSAGGGGAAAEREADVIECTTATGRIQRIEGPCLTLTSVVIRTPNLRHTLYPSSLSFSLPPGASLLVMGPSGCGKSSLLRAIAGLWKFGEGTIESPPPGKTFFLPQKPYMPLGTLRDQLVFPGNALEGELLHALQEVSLPDLAERVGGLAVECDYSDMLSMGEQQRVAFARLLLQRPYMAFLDEATSALDGANEARLYGMMRERVKSFVSVGHRTSLMKFHTLVLAFDEDGEGAPFQHLKRNESDCNEDESEEPGDLHPYADEIRHLIQNPPPPNHVLPPGTTPPPPLNDPGVTTSSALPSQAPSSSSPSSSFHWVSTEHQLASLAALLESQDEFAVDTEQHSHRSFLGFTALIQISTPDGSDYIIDAIALHDHIGHALRPVFANPAVTKLFHGADSDVLWLQRDFHIYTVNLFDTARACSVLNKPYRSLAFLLDRYCHVSTDKRLQLADWRRRPLPPTMLQYARTDSHYLPHIAGRLRWELVQADTGGEGGEGAFANGKGEAVAGGAAAAAAAAGAAAGAGGGGRRGSRAGHSSGSKYEEAVRRSNALCLQLYEKPGERSAGADRSSAVGEAGRERGEREEGVAAQGRGGFGAVGGSAEAAAAAAAALFRQLLGVCGYVGGSALSGGFSGDSAGSGAGSVAPDAAATSAGQKTSDRSEVLREVRAVLDVVTRWRDTVAREEHESLRFLLADVAVVAVALLRPATCQELIGCVAKAMAAAAALTPPSMREEAGVPRPIQGGGSGGESGTVESTEGAAMPASVAEQQATPSQPTSPSPSPPLVRRSPELVALINATCRDVRGGEGSRGLVESASDTATDPPPAPLPPNLASPLSVRLLFQPKGRPEDDENEFYIQSKSNRCVSCGESTHYLRYRLVPSCYRHAFPEHLKSHRSHDIVLLCVDCHDVAHRAAEIHKREVARRFGVPLLLSPLDRRLGGGSGEGVGERGGEGAGEGGSVVGNGAEREGGEEEGGGEMEGEGGVSGERNGGRDARVEAAFLLNDAARSAVAVLRHGASLPESRLCELLLPVWKVLKRAAGSPVKIEELEMVVQAGKGTRHGTKVVALLLAGGGEAGIREFTQQWREVFVAALQPRFLPPGWDVQHLGRRQFGEFSVYNPQRRRYVREEGNEGGREGGEGGGEGGEGGKGGREEGRKKGEKGRNCKVPHWYRMLVGLRDPLMFYGKGGRDRAGGMGEYGSVGGEGKVLSPQV
ncbi:unnamed protein product, partial [Closterium sp. Yama58-4]